MNGKSVEKDLKGKLPEKHYCLRVWPFGPKGSLVAELEHQETHKVTYWSIESAIKKLDLDAAIPALERAKDATERMTRDEFHMLRAFNRPPQAFCTCITAVLHMLAGIDRNIPVDSRGKLKTDDPWRVFQRIVSNDREFVNRM